MEKNNKPEDKQQIRIIYPDNETHQDFVKEVDKNREIFKTYVRKIEKEQKGEESN